MHKTLGIAAACLALGLTAGCATPRDRVSAALVEAGVPQGPADCFSADVTSQLTVDELRAVATAVSEVRAAGRDLTLADALRLANEAGDARTAGILLTAAARCA